MAASFFFYDLETSGFNPRQARIMQFAGQRTDMDLNPIGEPVNLLIKLTPDVLPSPDAVMITGITPQMTLSDGVTEAEFLKFFYQEVVKPETIFVGYNSLRFDDEFMRFLHYRNFYDAYEWHWANSCSRWDLLDAVRMVRALKPEGIKWPYAPDGKPTNRLEFLAKLNKLTHVKAHDALSDVHATIDLASLLKAKQPQLFEHLLSVRLKAEARQVVESGKPFMYTSGRYSSDYLHTTAAVMLGRPAPQDYVLVYDLRHDPTPYLNMGVDELLKLWRYNPDPEAERLPIKTLKYNRCPAVVPGVVADKATLERLKLSRQVVTDNLNVLSKAGSELAKRMFQVVAKLDEERQAAQLTLVANELTVDERLYDGFIDKDDAKVMREVRDTRPEHLVDLVAKFQDERLKSLLPLYKARNFPKALTAEERAEWDKFIHLKLMAGGADGAAARYFNRLSELAAGKLSGEQRYWLEELQLYGESIIPGDAAG